MKTILQMANFGHVGPEEATISQMITNWLVPKVLSEALLDLAFPPSSYSSQGHTEAHIHTLFCTYGNYLSPCGENNPVSI